MTTTRAPFTAGEVARYYSVRAPGIRQTSTEVWRGPCPIHQGTRDSFAVKSSDGSWFCHSECNRGGGIYDFEMALTDREFKVAAAEVDRIVGRERKQREVVATYDYRAEDGTLLFQVVRFEPKDFRQRRPDGSGGWIWNLDGVRRVLYRLDEVVTWDSLAVVEGESDVEALRALKLRATCSPMGAGKWRDEFAGCLRDRDVVIFFDRDEPGRRHCLQVCKSLLGKASRLRVADLPAEHNGRTIKDVRDFIQAGATQDEIRVRVKAAPDLDAAGLDALARAWFPPSEAAPEPDGPPPSPPSPHEGIHKLVAVDGLQVYRANREPPVAVVEGLLYRGVSIFAGRPKVGKSWLVLNLALSVARGNPFLGRLAVPASGRVVYLGLEEPQSRTCARLRALIPEPDERLQNIDFIYSLRPLLAGGAAELDSHLAAHPAQLVIVDTLLAILQAGAKRDVLRSDYAEVNILRQLAEKHDTAIVVVHHTRKMGAEYHLDTVTGTSGVTAAADSVWTLRRLPTGECILEVTGREMEDKTYALRFKSGGEVGWTLTGEGAEVGLSEERQEIIELLRDEAPLKPAKIALLLRKNAVAIRRLLQKLCRKGLILKNDNGGYFLSSSGGNSGNGGE